MGLFFKVEEKGKFLQINMRKYALAAAFLPLIAIHIIIPLTRQFFTPYVFGILASSAWSLTFVFGMWVACEGIYYGYFFSKEFEKNGNEVVRSIGKGIKIYKKTPKK